MEQRQQWIEESTRVAELNAQIELSEDDSEEIEKQQEDLASQINLQDKADGLIEFQQILPFHKTRLLEFYSYIEDINNPLNGLLK